MTYGSLSRLSLERPLDIFCQIRCTHGTAVLNFETQRLSVFKVRKTTTADRKDQLAEFLDCDTLGLDRQKKKTGHFGLPRLTS